MYFLLPINIQINNYEVMNLVVKFISIIRCVKGSVALNKIGYIYIVMGKSFGLI